MPVGGKDRTKFFFRCADASADLSAASDSSGSTRKALKSESSSINVLAPHMKGSYMTFTVCDSLVLLTDKTPSFLLKGSIPRKKSTTEIYKKIENKKNIIEMMSNTQSRVVKYSWKYINF